MLKRYHHIVGGVFRVTDACVIAGAWIASYFFRFHLHIIEVTKGLPKFNRYAALTPLVVAIWMGVFSFMKVYQSRRMLRRTHEAQNLIRAHLVSLLLFIAMTYLITEYRYSRAVMLSFGVMGGVALVFFRLTLRNALRSLRKHGYNLRHVLVIGEGASVPHLLHSLKRFPELGLRTQGILTAANSQTREIQGIPVIGHYADCIEAIRKQRPDQIIIALPRAQAAELDGILSQLKDETADIQLIPDIHEYVTLASEIEDFDGIPVVKLNDSPLSGWGAHLKRLTDFALSGLALLILSPFLLLVALAIKITSPGPILYSQERMGIDGRTFKIWKFRSMRVDAESNTGAVWAQAGDDRRTPIGALLRSTSIDELPQLWNVLAGDMSLVGPRPERPVFVDKFRTEIPHYMLRHKVKAGLTGWAQVNGWRGNTSLEKRIECDLYYIRNWSYFFDWKIMLMTVYKGFINKNAY